MFCATRSSALSATCKKRLTFFPVSGEVVEINEAVSENLEQMSSDPFGAGWLAKVKLSNPADLEDLMDVAAYDAHVESEAD